MCADHGVALLPVSRHDNGLHACHPPRADLRDQLGYPLRVGEQLRALDQQPGHCDAAARSEVAGRLVGVVQANQASGAHHVLVDVGELAVVVGVLAQLGLELAHLLLQLDNVVTIDLLSLCGVEVFAYRACTLARQATGQGGIASCFTLQTEWELALAKGRRGTTGQGRTGGGGLARAGFNIPGGSGSKP